MRRNVFKLCDVPCGARGARQASGRACGERSSLRSFGISPHHVECDPFTPQSFASCIVALSNRRTLTPKKKISANSQKQHQASEGSRALAENSILCLDDRTPLGRIEDIFGPVKAPLYALRRCGEAADAPAVGVAVFAVTKHAQFVVPEKLKSRG